MSDLQNLENALEALTKDLPVALVEALHEARSCRDSVRSTKPEDDISALHEQLVVNRAMIERLEYLTSSLGLMKSRTEAAVAQRKAEYDDAYVAAATKKTVGFSDYASAKEKDAHAALGTVNETINLRKAEATHGNVTAAYYYCRELLHGAQGCQRDMETGIRLISLRSQLER